MIVLGKDLFDAFARSYDPPSWIIEDLLEAGPDPIRAALDSALRAIPDQDIEALDDDAKATAEVCFAGADASAKCRLYLLSSEIAGAIEQARLAAIAYPAGPRPPPYDHPTLCELAVDDDGLVPLAAFDLRGDALCVGDHAFFVLPPVPGSNANYWLLEQFRRKGLVDSVRVRLDPILFGPSDRMAGRHYRMDVYGRPLDWERIRHLQNSEHGKWIPGKLSRRSLATEYAWVPHSDEVDFLCEELPTASEVTGRGARYLHAVYNKARHQLTHLDGAVRVYTPDQLTARALTHVRKAGKAGVRVKVFRTDRAMDPDLMAELAQAFFVWNYDVARYFGAPVPADF